MIDKKNRLVKLARRSDTYDLFEGTARRQTRWYFKPWIETGNGITRSWLMSFYTKVTGRIC